MHVARTPPSPHWSRRSARLSCAGARTPHFRPGPRRPLRGTVTASPKPDELAEVLAEVRRIEVQSNRLVSSVMAGGYSSVFRGSGLEFLEVREFADGDDPRLIDWKVTARTGRPFVKRFVDERELTVMFLLDVSASMDGGFGVWSARQMAVRLCACLAFAAVQNHDKVGLIAFGEREVAAFVPPQRGSAHALRIVRDGLLLQVGGGGTGAVGARGIDAALDRAARLLKRRSVVFVLSDFLGGEIGRPLLRCAQRHDLTAVRVLSPELFPPRAGLVRLRDPETGVERIVDWSNERVRLAWLARVARWRQLRDAEFERGNIDVVDVPVPMLRDRDAIAGPILKFFRMRQLRGAKR